VPFHQFRHLTFQEFIAAPAAAERDYIEYRKSDTALTPLDRRIFRWRQLAV
jgi:hypothetical protein